MSNSYQQNPQIILRNKPAILNHKDYHEVLGIQYDMVEGRAVGHLRPCKYLQHDFRDLGDVIIDQATGLMWQKSGFILVEQVWEEPWQKRRNMPPSHEFKTYQIDYDNAQRYIQWLNDNQFAGYKGWRIPTTPELISLIEPEKQINNLYLNPLFDATIDQSWCSDEFEGFQNPLIAGFSVNFCKGIINTRPLFTDCGVRAVRSM